MLDPNPEKETIDLPVRIHNGEVQLNREVLPPHIDLEVSFSELVGETDGWISIPVTGLEDLSVSRELSKEWREIVVPSTVPVWFEVRVPSERDLSEGARSYLSDEDLPRPEKGKRRIPVVLREHLWLHHKGLRTAKFENCRCRLKEDRFKGELVSSTEDMDAQDYDSLNQALMSLSEVFEVHRSTNTGSVYEKGWISSPDGEEWIQLDELRRRSSTHTVWKDRGWLRPYWVEDADSGEITSLAITEIESSSTEAFGPVLYIRDGEAEKVAYETMDEAASELRERGFRAYRPLEDPDPRHHLPD